MIHYIADACLLFPQACIVISEFGWHTDYYRAHLAVFSAAECITVLDDIALVALSLTFGGFHSPSL